MRNTDVEVVTIAPVVQQPAAADMSQEDQEDNGQTPEEPAEPAEIIMTLVTTPAVLRRIRPFLVETTATFTNTGGEPAMNLVAEFLAGNGAFDVSSGDCPTSLAAGASCQVTFSTTFTSTGIFEITVTFTASGQVGTETLEVIVTNF